MLGIESQMNDLASSGGDWIRIKKFNPVEFTGLPSA